MLNSEHVGGRGLVTRAPLNTEACVCEVIEGTTHRFLRETFLQLLATNVGCSVSSEPVFPTE